MKVVLVHPSKVVPYARNPRKNQDAVAKVAASIREFGFRQPIVVDSEMTIVVGHTRYLAALELGLEKIPVHVAEGLSPEQIKAYRIMDNRSHEDSEWGAELLSLELSDLKDADFDLDLTGFEDDEIAEVLAKGIVGTAGLTDPDDVPEPPDEAITQPGDLWILGDHRLLCGDSGNAADVDYLLAGASIHLVNTDPPYNVKVEPRSNNAIAAGLSSFGGGDAIEASDAQGMHHQGFDLARHKTKAKATHKKLRPKDRPLANDFVSDEEFDKLLRAWFGNIARVLEPGRGFYIWGGYANCGNNPPVLKEVKLYFSQAIIWVKEHPVLTRKDFMGNHEWCFYGSDPGKFASLNGKLYFSANDGTNGSELWETGGTAAGTVLVKDINPGAAGSWPLPNLFRSPFGYQSGTFDRLWFTATDGATGFELWTTDGTAAGTTMWSDFRSGSGDGVWID